MKKRNRLFATKIEFAGKEWIGDFKELSEKEVKEREQEITNALCGKVQTVRITQMGKAVIFPKNIIMNSVISIIECGGKKV